MVNAGRILILAKGAWSATTNYMQLDLVSYNSIAYLARQASVGVNPAQDTQMSYWMPFGSAAGIATTSTPGLVMPDGTTITVTNTGLIKAVLGLNDVSDVTITSPANGQVIKYNSSTQKWENGSLGTAAAKNSTNAVTQSSTDLVESGAVYTETSALNSALSNKINTSDIANNLTTTTTGKVLDATQGKALSDTIGNSHKVTSFEVTTTSWSSDTTSQSGTTLYKKSISLSHVYVDSPSVDIGAASGSVLPTVAQQTAYDLLQYVTCDSAIPCLYLYASDIPTTAFYINVEGVD